MNCLRGSFGWAWRGMSQDKNPWLGLGESLLLVQPKAAKHNRHKFLQNPPELVPIGTQTRENHSKLNSSMKKWSPVKEDKVMMKGLE